MNTIAASSRTTLVTRVKASQPKRGFNTAGPAPAKIPTRRVVTFADDGPTDADFENVGLDDILGLVEASESAAQAKWRPGSLAPEYLTGELPGDYGFDPMGLGADPANLARFRETELMHCRWAMLGVAGILGAEALGQGSWLDAPKWAVEGGSPSYFGVDIPLTLPMLLGIEVVAMGVIELRRAGIEDLEERMYPGGSFDPFGYSKGDIESLKLKEIKNGRLAMLAVLGFAVQGAFTGQSPLEAWGSHLADPMGDNIVTNLFKAFM
mmetsp:Transcript_35777/g.43191  ORF Transcript_35777/g.43191 Transcript_35777/m.43191 type:complete len:266 (-) Transcript_35777:262-1059(-)|eukprot:CAMPEP_0197862872 /NCGR_PEP_ID=MMETSP1438-20131217/39949_1 /TAXON_ID=1461541 /ORGANISM="Pterosperma sp., Strain CCMP1384" /LENGTH=265 /DNA_ID=CAMNT_0043480577 /DNA_START=55 /DNA_END=852 /DNA_ORIENTATION=-